MWGRGLEDNEPCGCGAPFSQCTFWRAVVERMWQQDGAPFSDVRALRERVTRTRYLPWIRYPRLAPRAWLCDAAAYAKAMIALYNAVSEVSGRTVIIDSSKRPAHAWFLLRWVPVDVFVLQILRDSRAVAYSLRRERLRLQSPSGVGAPMARRSVIRSGLEWLTTMVTSEALLDSRSVAPSMRIKYEDLVQDPDRILLSAAGALGLPAPDRNRDGKILLPISHAVSGNPMRFQSGPLVLSADQEWKTDMRRLDRILVTALTATHLSRFGYLGTRPT